MLAASRATGDVSELPGVSIASLGARFQMFNAAYFSAPVAGPADLEDRIRLASRYFSSRATRWSFWVCEDWLAPPARRVLNRSFDRAGLRIASEMPGMVAEALRPPKRALPDLDCYPVDSPESLADFQGIGSLCFHVPLLWFTEVFDAAMLTHRPRFECWVGYHEGLPVATAATVRTGEVLGLYNVATEPGHRKRGYAEAITRHVVAHAAPRPEALVLQSTTHGLRMYERLGFRTVTRILVYNSMP